MFDYSDEGSLNAVYQQQEFLVALPEQPLLVQPLRAAQSSFQQSSNQASSPLLHG
jgi:hypothetical protein